MLQKLNKKPDEHYDWSAQNDLIQPPKASIVPKPVPRASWRSKNNFWLIASLDRQKLHFPVFYKEPMEAVTYQTDGCRDIP